MDTCIAWLPRMKYSELASLAEDLDIKMARDSSKPELCQAIKKSFKDRCNAAQHLSNAQLLKVLNSKIFKDVSYKVSANTSRDKLCAAVAATLSKEGECSKEGLNLYQCAASNAIKSVDDRYRVTKAIHDVRKTVGSVLGAKELGRKPLDNPGTLGYLHAMTHGAAHKIGYLTLPDESDSDSESTSKSKLSHKFRKNIAFTTRPILTASRKMKDRTPWESNTARRQTGDKSKTFNMAEVTEFGEKCRKLGTKQGLVRVLTQNCHLRPSTGPAYCRVNFDDVQMKRACQIVTSIQHMQGTTSEADIICLQEVFETKRQERIIRGLKHRYKFVAHSTQNAGSLTLSKYEIVFKQFISFERVASADALMDKGMLITLHKISNRRYLLVFNIHPSPYVLAPGLQTTYADIYRAHVGQLNQIRERSDYFSNYFQTNLKRGRIITIFAGDFNINRYATLPDSADEKNADKANMCCSNEFIQAEHILNAVQPPLTVDPTVENWYGGTSNVATFTRDLLDKSIPLPIPGHGGVYTWDGSENTITQNPLWPPSFQMIDFIMVSNSGHTPAYMDNRVVRLPTKDVIPWISRAATHSLCDSAENVANQKVYTENNRKRNIMWRKKNGEPDLTSYDPNNCGVDPRSMSGEELEQWRKEKESGFFDDVTFDFTKTNPPPYPMFNNVSDHYGVLAYIVFPRTEAAEYAETIVPLSVYSLDAMKNSELALTGKSPLWIRMKRAAERPVRDSSRRTSSRLREHKRISMRARGASPRARGASPRARGASPRARGASPRARGASPRARGGAGGY